MPYAGALCHDGSLPYDGISLYAVGSGNTAQPYAKIEIGYQDASMGANTALNVFDTICRGINARNANVSVTNSAFMSIRKTNIDVSPDYTSLGKIGIAAVCDDKKKYQLLVHPAYYTYIMRGPHIRSFGNSFYDCHDGVYSSNYYNIEIDSNAVFTTQRLGSTLGGNNGYKIQSGAYENIDMSYNAMYNVANGITLKMAPGPLSVSIAGQVAINRNRIYARVPTDATGLRYVDKAIWAESSIAYGGLPGLSNPFNVDDNYMREVYNGIYIGGVGTQAATSLRNSVINGLDYLSPTVRQYGIWHSKCAKDQTSFCIVKGTNYKNDKWIGILSSGCAFPNVKCNSVANVGRAFQFENENTVAVWNSNDIFNSLRGFVLSSSKITQQGTASAPCANRWLVTWGSTFAWNMLASPATYQTYTEGTTIPSVSPLYVKNVGVSDPGQNGKSFPFVCGGVYGCISGVIGSSGNGLFPVPAAESLCAPVIPLMRIAAMEQIAHAAPDFDGFETQQLWNSQDALWREMVQDDTLGNCSDTLIAFRAMAAHSRYAWFTDIEQALAKSDVPAAQALLLAHGIDDLATTDTDNVTGVVMGDGTGADELVSNCYNYYTLYAQYMADTLTTEEKTQLEAIAMQCPVTGGPAVYKARALYNLVFDSLRVFEDHCYDTVGTTGGKTASGNGIKAGNFGQRYELYPNPNEGEFMLRQLKSDDGAVVAEVYDVTGRLMHTGNIQFLDGESRLNMGDAAPGVYLLKLMDAQGRLFTFKFVVR